MKKNKSATKKVFWTVILFSTLSLVACGREPSEDMEETQIANPAAEYCLSNGGEYEAVDEENGQVGVCSFSEYGVCEEWDFYNSGICGEYVDENNPNFSLEPVEIEEEDVDENIKDEQIGEDTQHGVSIANPASEFCEQLGGMISIVESEGGEMGMCNFSDGTSCEEWSLYNKQCGVDKIPAELLGGE